MAESESNSSNDRGRGARARRRHPVLRWVFRVVLFVVILLVLAAIAVQIVLSTTVPKSLVVGQVEKGMGNYVAGNTTLPTHLVVRESSAGPHA